MQKIGIYRTVVFLALLVMLGFTKYSSVKADGNSIVGTWIVTTSPSMSPGTPPFVYPELVSFNPGGTLIDTHAIAHSSENLLLPPAVTVDSSDAFGIWHQLGDLNQFATIHKRLLFAGPNTPSSLYGPFFPGQLVGFETVHTVLSLQANTDGDTLGGPFTVEFTNLTGQVVFSDTGTISAKRLK
jgi:hypothetical protein